MHDGEDSDHYSSIPWGCCKIGGGSTLIIQLSLSQRVLEVVLSIAGLG